MIVSPRTTKNNSTISTEQDNVGSPYAKARPPSVKSSKKHAQNNELNKVMVTDTSALESAISSKKNDAKLNLIEDDDFDDTFGKMLIGQLKLIPECDLKDDLKIDLQQTVLKSKRQVIAQKENSVRQRELYAFTTPLSPPVRHQNTFAFTDLARSRASFSSPPPPTSISNLSSPHGSSSSSHGY